MIFETIVTTVDNEGNAKISPFGIKKKGKFIYISPYLPSKTYENLKSNNIASINYVDDANIFVRCILGDEKFLLKSCKKISCFYLEETLSFDEVKVVDFQPNIERPTFKCEIVNQENCKPFLGFNRSRAALIEACILATRVKILPIKKITEELDYLAIAIEKTSGLKEYQSWKEIRKLIDKQIKK